MKKSELQQIIREEIKNVLNEEYSTRFDLKKDHNNVVSNIQKRWGPNTVKKETDNSSFSSKFSKLKQKMGLDRYLQTRIEFKDPKKSPVKRVTVFSYFPKKDSKYKPGIDIVASDGWKDTASMDWSYETSSDLTNFFTDVEKFYNRRKK